ncbi:MAG: hypothetical protein ACQKBT_07620 [Puniceicoccales bacterium]
MSFAENSDSTTQQWFDALSLADDGDWEGAHEMVQSGSDPFSFWIHANLHREEGDPGNASYWYQRAGEKPRQGGFREEREEIRKAVRDLIGE